MLLIRRTTHIAPNHANYLRLWTIAPAALLSLLTASGCGERATPRNVTEATLAPRFTSTSEGLFRAEALESPRPRCSGHVSRTATTVVVADVSVGMSGRVLEVAIQEAPSEEASATIAEGLRKWKFKPLAPLDGSPQIFSGTVTFYLAPSSGGCQVLSPDEVGYVGRWPVANSRLGATLPAGTSVRE
jgi:hypothetical protein